MITTARVNVSYTYIACSLLRNLLRTRSGKKKKVTEIKKKFFFYVVPSTHKLSGNITSEQAECYCN